MLVVVVVAWSDEPPFVGNHDRLHPIPDLQLREDVSDIGLDRALTQV